MIALLLWGCVEAGQYNPLPAPDLDVFVHEVQPILGSACANPACHGSVDRPLEVHAVSLHRLDPDDRWVQEPLTDEELWRDYQSASLFLVDIARADDSELLRKPLAEGAGGMTHVGGDWFSDTANPDYQRIAAWIAAALGEAP